LKSLTNLRHSIVAVACLALLAVGCGLPHYVILDDPLSPQEHLKRACPMKNKASTRRR